jgi:hypothetical protein
VLVFIKDICLGHHLVIFRLRFVGLRQGGVKIRIIMALVVFGSAVSGEGGDHFGIGKRS